MKRKLTQCPCEETSDMMSWREWKTVKTMTKKGKEREVTALTRCSGTRIEFMARLRCKLAYFVQHAWKTDWLREQTKRLWDAPPPGTLVAHIDWSEDIKSAPRMVRWCKLMGG